MLLTYKWVLAARARPCAARTRLFELIATPNGPLRAPPPRPLQLRCFLFFFLSTGPQRQYNMRIADFVILFFFFSPFQFFSFSSLLILLFFLLGAILRLLILLLLYFKLFFVLQTCIWMINTCMSFWGVSRGGQAFFDPFGVRPNFFGFILFYSSLHISSYSSLLYYILPLLILLFLYLNLLRLVQKSSPLQEKIMKNCQQFFSPFLQPLAQQVFPREELPREPAVAGQVQRQRASAQQSAALPHAGLRQSREDLCPGRIVLLRCQQSGTKPGRDGLLQTIWNGASAGKRTATILIRLGTIPCCPGLSGLDLSRGRLVRLQTIWNGTSAILWRENGIQPFYWGCRQSGTESRQHSGGKTECNHFYQALHCSVLACANIEHINALSCWDLVGSVPECSSRLDRSLFRNVFEGIINYQGTASSFQISPVRDLFDMPFRSSLRSRLPRMDSQLS